MKLLILSFIVWGVSLSANGQNITHGRVIDEHSQPMPYVNVVLLNHTDSAFIQGVMTKDDGTFSIPTENQNDLLKISSVGYVSLYIQARQSNLGDIQMQCDNQMLSEIVVKGRIPSYRMTPEGIQTNVENTVLSKLGTGEDVLAHIPGITKKQEGFEVFGKGKPLVYINGKLMRDASELDQLKSENIKSIELITNPSAKYDASVKAVVKIRTKAVNGEGFGFDVRSSYYQSENTDLVEQLNWNYRRNRLDVFGMVYYGLNNIHHLSNNTTLVEADTLWQQKFYQNSNYKRQTLTSSFGTNYALDDDNSIGFKYTLKVRPDAKARLILSSEITANHELYDRVENIANGVDSYRPDHLLNVYYNGKIGKVGIDFNTDYLKNQSSSTAVYDERSDIQNRIVHSRNEERNEMFASKLTMDYPLLGGGLTFGAEYTHTTRHDDYINPEQYVPTSFAKLKESHIASFAEYTRQISRFQFTAGLRYEWVDFDYYENGQHLNLQSRSFGNLFPSLSMSTQIGQIQMQLGYTAKTNRPTYQQLSNNVTYGNRFLLQSGNPRLNHEYIHDLSLMGVWKFLQLTVGYNDRRNAIIYWTEQMANNSAVTRITQLNIPTLKSVIAQVAVAPKIGIWSPELSIGMQKQWLTLHTTVDNYRLNAPFFQFSLNNSFDFSHGWVASVDAYLTTKGNQENAYFSRSNGAVNVSLTKSMLNDRLSIRIQGNDLFHTEKSRVIMYAGQMQGEQTTWSDSREIVLTLRYKFNTSQSKYKGTGAGNSEKNRL
ncbi:MAG: outer membrane beta-barrel protein [Prevotella sp.]|nr:outer membrane beta-barrel protein [Prevotella sp.]